MEFKAYKKLIDVKVEAGKIKKSQQSDLIELQKELMTKIGEIKTLRLEEWDKYEAELEEW